MALASASRYPILGATQASEPRVPTYYAELVKIMLAHGCEQLPGGKGSHEKWKSPINGRTVIVPRSKSRHTANAVLKQLGIGKQF